MDGAVGLTVAAHNSLAKAHFFTAGNEAQRQKFATPLGQGKMLGAWSLTEPEAGSDDTASRQWPARTEMHGC